MRGALRREGGFTLVEILTALVIMTIGLAGILAMHSSAVRANAGSRRLDRARQVAEQLMEELRGLDVAAIEAEAPLFPDTLPASVGEVVYTRELVVAPIAGQTNLVSVQVAVSYAEEGDNADRRFARLEMIRTRSERL